MPNDLIDQSHVITLNATMLARDCQQLFDDAARKLRSFEAFERELDLLYESPVSPTPDRKTF